MWTLWVVLGAGGYSWQHPNTYAPHNSWIFYPWCCRMAAHWNEAGNMTEGLQAGKKENWGAAQQCSFTKVNIFCRYSSCVRKRSNLLCCLNILSEEGMSQALWAISSYKPWNPPRWAYADLQQLKSELWSSLAAINSSLASLFISIAINWP